MHFMGNRRMSALLLLSWPHKTNEVHSSASCGTSQLAKAGSGFCSQYHSASAAIAACASSLSRRHFSHREHCSSAGNVMRKDPKYSNGITGRAVCQGLELTVQDEQQLHCGLLTCTHCTMAGGGGGCGATAPAASPFAGVAPGAGTAGGTAGGVHTQHRVRHPRSTKPAVTGPRAQ